MAEQTEIAKKLDAAGWSVFFLWVGVALLSEVGWGVGLLGVGLVTLAGQAGRHLSNLNPEGFWVVVGMLFLVGGLGAQFRLELPMGPIVLIGAGLALLISLFADRRTASR